MSPAKIWIVIVALAFIVGGSIFIINALEERGQLKAELAQRDATLAQVTKDKKDADATLVKRDKDLQILRAAADQLQRRLKDAEKNNLVWARTVVPDDYVDVLRDSHTAVTGTP